MVNTIILDDHRLFSDGLEKLLIDSKKFNVLKKFTNGIELLQSVDNFDLHLLLIDIEMKSMDGIEVIRRINLLNKKDFKIVMISMHEESIYKREAQQAGANGYICKSTNESLFIEQLLAIINNQKVETDWDSPIKEVSILSKQELRVLKLISVGKNTNDISKELLISAFTVKVHRRNILRKLNANNSAECVNIAISKGLF
jgi:DNA-binding NarL/FixJ family response regulator